MVLIKHSSLVLWLVLLLLVVGVACVFLCVFICLRRKPGVLFCPFFKKQPHQCNIRTKTWRNAERSVGWGVGRRSPAIVAKPILNCILVVWGGGVAGSSPSRTQVCCCGNSQR